MQPARIHLDSFELLFELPLAPSQELTPVSIGSSETKAPIWAAARLCRTKNTYTAVEVVAVGVDRAGRLCRALVNTNELTEILRDDVTFVGTFMQLFQPYLPCWDKWEGSVARSLGSKWPVEGLAQAVSGQLRLQAYTENLPISRFAAIIDLYYYVHRVFGNEKRSPGNLQLTSFPSGGAPAFNKMLACGLHGALHELNLALAQRYRVLCTTGDPLDAFAPPMKPMLAYPDILAAAGVMAAALTHPDSPGSLSDTALCDAVPLTVARLAYAPFNAPDTLMQMAQFAFHPQIWELLSHECRAVQYYRCTASHNRQPATNAYERYMHKICPNVIHGMITPPFEQLHLRLPLSAIYLPLPSLLPSLGSLPWPRSRVPNEHLLDVLQGPRTLPRSAAELTPGYVRDRAAAAPADPLLESFAQEFARRESELENTLPASLRSVRLNGSVPRGFYEASRSSQLLRSGVSMSPPPAPRFLSSSVELRDLCQLKPLPTFDLVVVGAESLILPHPTKPIASPLCSSQRSLASATETSFMAGDASDDLI